MTSQVHILQICFPTMWILCFCLVTKSRLTLWDPMDYSLPGSSVYGISQARILQWVPISCSRGSSRLMDQTHFSYIGRRRIPTESPGKAAVWITYSFSSEVSFKEQKFSILMQLINYSFYNAWMCCPAKADLLCVMCVGSLILYFTNILFQGHRRPLSEEARICSCFPT